VVVHPELLQKRSETAERILMTLVESLAFSMAPANKAVVIKTMMRRFQISDPVVGEEGYQDYLTSVERKTHPEFGWDAKHQTIDGFAQSESSKRQN
jgi:ABC-type nitrate/sulfonate/bicarbonate transport system substrate-binding protein